MLVSLDNRAAVVILSGYRQCGHHQVAVIWQQGSLGGSAVAGRMAVTVAAVGQQ